MRPATVVAGREGWKGGREGDCELISGPKVQQNKRERKDGREKKGRERLTRVNTKSGLDAVMVQLLHQLSNCILSLSHGQPCDSE